MPKLPPHILWPGIIVALLGMSVTMVTITVVAATGDPSFAVERDYYERGLRWDDHMAQLAQNEELGWRAEVEVGDADASGRRPLAVNLTDASGAPIDGALVEASIFHYAESARVQALALGPAGVPGRYLASVDMRQAGKWMVALEVRAGQTVFTHEHTIRLEQ